MNTKKKLNPQSSVPDMSIQPVKTPDVSIQPVEDPVMSIQPVKTPQYKEAQKKYNGSLVGDDKSVRSPDSQEKEPQKWIKPIEGSPPSAPVESNPGTGTTPGIGTDPNMSYLINLPGLSDSTKQALGNLINTGYQPSQTVADALTELNRVISNQPAEFQSQYFDQLNGVMNKILGREAFSYDLASDPMYQQYRDQYMQAGRQAMQDTMGQAAAMTGGYGSSYASTAGNQAYQQHLAQLNEMAPELYQMALQQYQMTGDQLQQQYSMLNDMYQTEYGQYQDQYDRWQQERNFYNDRYYNERDYDYTDYRNRLGDWKDIANQERDQYNVDRDFANAERDYYYNYAMQMIQAGKMPSQDIIDRLGLSEDDIRKLRKYYKNQNGGGSSGGGSSGGSSSSSSSSSGGGDDGKTGKTPLPSVVPKPSELLDEEDYKEYLERMRRRNVIVPELK